MKWPHDRSLYRIEYPSRERPELDVGGATFEVIDICEQGIRYKLPNDHPQVGDTVSGVLRFREADEVVIQGVILRVHGNEYAVLRLDPPGISQKLILDQQRFLLRRYPGRDPRV